MHPGLRGTLAVAISLAAAAPAEATVAPNAAVVKLLQSCGGADDCFETLPALVAWIGGIRAPSAAHPLVVDIGPGVFTGDYYECAGVASEPPPFPDGNAGHVVFRGSGRSATTLRLNVLSGVGCRGLEFHDLRIEGADPADPAGALLDFASSQTLWTNVDVDRGYWYEEDDRCYGREHLPFEPVHVWLDSNITTLRSGLQIPDNGTLDQGIAYSATCDTTRFYGGSITVDAAGPIGGTSSPYSFFAAVAAGRTGEFYGWGTKLTARVAGRPALHGADPNLPQPLFGAVAGLWTILGADIRGGEIQLEAGEVLVDGSAVGNQPVVGAIASADGEFSTEGTRFTLAPGPGASALRLSGPPEAFHSRLFHVPGDSEVGFASKAGDAYAASLTGMDAYLQTGCSSSGACDGHGSEVHAMVADSSCLPSSAWRDQVTGICAAVTVVDNCPTVANPSQADADGDGVGDLCDNCVSVANPRITPLGFQLVTGGQLDDDADGYGNRCDGDFDNDLAIGPADASLFSASLGKSRAGSNCGSQAAPKKCATFDLDGRNPLIGAPDKAVFEGLAAVPGPKCPQCPLP